MAATVDARLAGVHPQMLRVASDSDRKKIAERVERTLELLGVSKQDAAFRMGYTDPGTVSRWCSGVERPHFDKLFVLINDDGLTFEDAWVIATAEKNPRMEVVTQIVMRRSA